jgi:dTDP-4-dehydrorhamnose reductase
MQLAQATARLVRQLSPLAEHEFPSGLYHTTAAGSVSWCGFARAIVSGMTEAGEAVRVRQIVPIPSDEYPVAAKRPLNSVLANDTFERTFGFRLGSWQHGLAEALREIRMREAGSSSR